METKKLILGIETSCDETAAAVVADGREVLSSIVLSQIAKHARYGGVVPELAAREHVRAISCVVGEALDQAQITLDKVSAIAVTNGPGLIPALLVGLNFARGLACSRNLPLIGVNHFMAHIYGAFLGEKNIELDNKDNYPIVALVVSGGHSALVLVQKDGKAEIIGSTIDDAAGEALDKAAKMLGLGYPGGPIIEKIASNGNPAKFAFPRSLTGSSGKALAPEDRFNFSFSGVKTSLFYHCKNFFAANPPQGELLYDTVASYQEAVLDVLTKKTLDAVIEFSAKSVVLCGGVACNSRLRTKITQTIRPDIKCFIAEPKYCTDNAAMVAGMAYKLYAAGYKDDISLDAFSRLPHFQKIPFITS